MNGRTALMSIATTIALAGCSPSPPAAPIALPTPPDLAGVEPLVRDQIRRRHELVARLLADPRTTGEGLGWGFGRLGMVYHAYLELARARSCYSTARRLDPEEFRWAYYLGQLERTDGNLETSSRHFEDALAMRPDDLPTLVWLGENALDERRLGVACARFATALEKDPTCAKARLGLGRIALAQDDLAAAVRHLELARSTQPVASPIHYTLAMVHRRLGAEDRARSLLRRLPRDDQARIPIAFDDRLMQEVSDLRSSSQYHARLGRKAVARGHLRTAVGHFERSVAADPDRPDTRYNLAASLLQLGRRQAARAEAEEIVEAKPDYVQARVLLARMQIGAGELAAAEEHLRQAWLLDPGAERVHLALGEVLRQSNDLEGALERYAWAQELAPELAGAPFGTATVLLLLDRFEEAARTLEEALVALPGSSQLELLLARLRAAAPTAGLRNGEGALELAKAAAHRAETVSAAETLAMAYAELRRFDEAVAWQQAAVERMKAAGQEAPWAHRRLALYRSGSPCRRPWAPSERPISLRVTPPPTNESRY